MLGFAVFLVRFITDLNRECKLVQYIVPAVNLTSLCLPGGITKFLIFSDRFVKPKNVIDIIRLKGKLAD